MTKAEQIKQLMKEYGQLERQAKAAFKKASDAHGKLWQSADGSTEAKHWNTEWKKQEAIGVSFREKANRILDRIERLKEQNPMPAKKRAIKRKASKKAPSLAQLRLRAKFAAAAKARSKASKKKAAKKPRRQNKTIITKPKKVVVINRLKNPSIHDASSMADYLQRGGKLEFAALNTQGRLSDWAEIATSRPDLFTVRRLPSRPGYIIVRLKKKNPYSDLVIKGFAQKTPQGWKIGKKTIPQGKGIVSVSSGYKLDRATGTVFAKRARNVAQGFFDGNGVFHPIRSSSDYDSGRAGEGRGSAVKRPVSKKRREAMRKASHTAKDKASYRVPIAGDTRRSRKNVAQGYFDQYGFHPIRSSADYDEGRVGTHTRSKKKKAATKRAARTWKDKAETRKRKSTTSRLASRSLSKSAGILKGSGSRRQRRNPPTSKRSQKGTGRYNREQLNKALARARRTGKPVLLAYWWEGWEGHENRIDHYAMPDGTTKDIRRPKKNPSPAENRREFAGHYTKDNSLRFPDGTPTGLSKLGTLKLIKLASGHELKPGTGTTWLCRDQKGKLHLGTTRPDGVIYNGGAGDLGKVKLIEYDERKDHLYPGEGVLRFYHKLGEDDGIKPSLISDGKGGLKFKGGNYKIESRGIVN